MNYQVMLAMLIGLALGGALGALLARPMCVREGMEREWQRANPLRQRRPDLERDSFAELVNTSGSRGKHHRPGPQHQE
jgi:hypothetical protein